MKKRSKPLVRTLGGTLTLSLSLLAAGLSIAALVGCSGSDSSESVVVQPPTPSASEADSSITREPPGGIEMPPGDIPPTSADTPPTQGIELPETVQLPADTGASTRPTVEYGTWDEIQAVARSSGRITVVDLWSLSCEPCLREFPGLVRLHQALGSSVQCIAVDLDFEGRKARPPEYYEERVVNFLEGVGATGFPTYISQTSSEDVFAAAQVVSIPAVLIYDAEGEIVKVFVDAGDSLGFSYDKDIIPLVTKLAG